MAIYGANSVRFVNKDYALSVAGSQKTPPYKHKKLFTSELSVSKIKLRYSPVGPVLSCVLPKCCLCYNLQAPLPPGLGPTDHTDQHITTRPTALFEQPLIVGWRAWRAARGSGPLLSP